jgi:hypothetical protein
MKNINTLMPTKVTVTGFGGVDREYGQRLWLLGRIQKSERMKDT